MYSITRLSRDRYLCECMSQSGVERTEETSLNEAVRAMIRSAEAINHAKITSRKIRFHGFGVKPDGSPTILESWDDETRGTYFWDQTPDQSHQFGQQLVPGGLIGSAGVSPSSTSFSTHDPLTRDSQAVLTANLSESQKIFDEMCQRRQASLDRELDRLKQIINLRTEQLAAQPVPSPEDVGPQKYPPGLKGWLLWLADRLP